MKGSGKLARARRFTVVLLVPLATAFLLFSFSGADEPSGRKTGQAVVKPVSAAPARVDMKANGTVSQSGAPAAAAITPTNLPALTGQEANGTQEQSSSGDQETPQHLSAIVKKISTLLESPKFTFLPDKGLDPFTPFISLQPSNDNGPPGNNGPLTPLQRMTLSEMERGLKAIVWGSLGRMAVIEDSTGKGYIVGVGTPAGPNGGVITKVENDRLVIQQEIWNSQTKKRTPEDFTLKLVKKDNG